MKKCSKNCLSDVELLIKLILYSKVVINKYNVKIPGNNNDISDFAQIFIITKTIYNN